MSEINALTEVLGAFVGVVGVSIAVWLQMVSAKRTPARYVAGFFVFGSIFLLTNSGAVGVPTEPANLLGLLGVLAALVAECGAAVFVHRRFGTDDRTPELLADLFDEPSR
jgi:drug/metabolite transporter (DMT)-like permease